MLRWTPTALISMFCQWFSLVCGQMPSCCLPLVQRSAVVVGLDGAGKSSLVELLVDKPRRVRVSVPAYYVLHVCSIT